METLSFAVFYQCSIQSPDSNLNLDVDGLLSDIQLSNHSCGFDQLNFD